MANEIMSVEGQLVGMPLAGPESFSQQQLDYLKRALGVDETVLYDGELKQVTNNTPVSGNVLSETFRNFKRVLLIGHTDDGTKCPFSILLEPLNSSGDMEWSVAVNNAGWCKWFCGNLNGTTITLTLGRVLTMGTTDWNYLHEWTINKVVGINRIAGGN